MPSGGRRVFGWEPAPDTLPLEVTSIWAGSPGASAVGIAKSASGRPIFGCSNICSRSRAGCSRGRSCSTLSGGRSAEVDERTVDVHIGRLRKRLSKGKERDPIRTVRGAGYAIDEALDRKSVV